MRSPSQVHTPAGGNASDSTAVACHECAPLIQLFGWILAFVTFAPAPPMTAASDINPELSLSLDRSVPDPDFKGEGRTPMLVLQHVPLQVKVTLAYAYVAESAKSAEKALRLLSAPDFVLPTGDWVDQVRVVLVNRGDEGGSGSKVETREIRRQPLPSARESASTEFRLKNGEVVYVDLALPELVPGDYLLIARIEREGAKPIASSAIPIAVRSGTESRGVYELYLRQQADAATTYDAFRSVVFRIQQEFPGEYIMMEQLARRALSRDELADAVTYYRIAREGFSKQLDQRKKDPDFLADLRDAAEQNEQRLSVVERVADYAVVHSGQVALRAKVVDGRDWFAWVDRADGKTLAPVDVTRPDSWRAHSRL